MNARLNASKDAALPDSYRWEQTDESGRSGLCFEDALRASGGKLQCRPRHYSSQHLRSLVQLAHGPQILDRRVTTIAPTSSCTKLSRRSAEMRPSLAIGLLSLEASSLGPP